MKYNMGKEKKFLILFKDRYSFFSILIDLIICK